MAEHIMVMEEDDHFLTMSRGNPRRWRVDAEGKVVEVSTFSHEDLPPAPAPRVLKDNPQA